MHTMTDSDTFILGAQIMKEETTYLKVSNQV